MSHVLKSVLLQVLSDTGTLARTASTAPVVTGMGPPTPYKMSGGGSGVDDLSFELDGAPYMSVPTRLYGLTEPQMRVLAALRELAPLIREAERTWRIDRRAIAGAIAWEALENWSVGGKKFTFGRRAVGLGKVHVYTSRITDDDNTVAKQIEDTGYLPPQSTSDRKALLGTPAGSITYIAAIMRAFTDMAAKYGFSIGGDPVILTNLFQGKDLPKWQARLEEHKKLGTTKLSGGNDMDLWVGRNLVFLEEAVGKPELPEY